MPPTALTAQIGAAPAVGSAWAVYGSHPGAGARTVASLLQLAGDQASTYALTESAPYGVPLVVCRSTAAGLAAAGHALSQVGPSAGLVVVRDIPAPLPRSVTYRLRVLRGQALFVAHVPYLWPLREADSPLEVTGSRSVARAARSLHNTLSKERQ